MWVWLWAVIAGFILMQLSCFVTTIYLHRGMTHRGIYFRKSVDVFFRAVLWLTTGIISKQWIAVHRKHHQFTDKEGDPHSPYLEGFWNIQLFNYRYYFRHINDENLLEKYSADIKNDWFDRHVFRYSTAGLLITTGVLCWILGWWGLLASGLSMILYVLMSSTINGLCHWVGYKNFENTAKNLQSVALISGGEGLHNNHHAFPACPKLSMKKFEFDPAWAFIKVMSWCKLCTPARTVSLDGPLHKTIVERLTKPQEA